MRGRERGREGDRERVREKEKVIETNRDRKRIKGQHLSKCPYERNGKDIISK